MLLLPPTTAELHLSFAAGATPSTGTPESLQLRQDGEGSAPPSSGLHLQQQAQAAGEQGAVAAPVQQVSSAGPAARPSPASVCLAACMHYLPP